MGIVPAMADVYLSYAPADRAAAQMVARALERRELTVAWDFDDATGDIADATEAALAAAGAVVVLWSPASGDAPWVETEAMLARRDDRLVQAATAAVRRPRRFRRDPLVDLEGWDGSHLHPAVDELEAAIEEARAAGPGPEPSLGPPPEVAAQARARSRTDPEAILGGGRIVLAGHEAEVYDLAWSPDGLAIATASADGTARLWDARGARSRAVLSGHRDEVNDVAFSPDGGATATASDDGTVRLWAAASGSQTAELQLHDGAVYWVAYSPAGTSAASAGADGRVVRWRAASGRTEWEFRHDAGVATARWLPDGTVIATGDDDGDVTLWDVESGDALRVIEAHDSAIADLAVSPVDTVVVSSSEEGQMAAWDMVDGSMLWWATDLAGAVVGLAFSPDGDYVAAADDEGINLWRARAGEPVGVIEDPDAARLEFSPDGRALAWASGAVVRILSSAPDQRP